MSSGTRFSYDPLRVDKNKAIYWDGKSDAGEEVASEIYFYSIIAGDFSAMRKMVVKK